jgi:hypothetical protein
VTTFAIEIVRGYRPNAVEVAGAGLTVGALVANNLLLRRRRVEAQSDVRSYEVELSEAA